MKPQYSQRINDFKLSNRALVVALVFVVVINALTSIFFYVKGLETAEDVFVPTDNPFGMPVTKNGVPEDCYVYMYQRNLLAAVYNWPTSGLKDFEKNIANYGYYMAPLAKKMFKDELESAEKERRLDRVRQPIDPDGDPLCKPEFVKKIGNGIWEVTTRFTMEESKGIAYIRKPTFEYKFNVKRVPAGPIPKSATDRTTRQNQFGLILYSPSGKQTRVEN